MFELKRLSTNAIPAALAQAERYRLLNEPVEAESICLDVLRVDPAHQDALVTLVLALTDQFPDGPVARAMAAAERAVVTLRDDYKRLYYSGIIRERRGKAELHTDRPGSHRAVHEWLREAMSCYEQAEAIRPAGNDEAILRWNTCARILTDLPIDRARHPGVPQRPIGVTEIARSADSGLGARLGNVISAARARPSAQPRRGGWPRVRRPPPRLSPTAPAPRRSRAPPPARGSTASSPTDPRTA